MSKTIITVRYESDAPYTESERSTIMEAIAEVVTDIDNDADGNSFTISAMSEAEEIDAKNQSVVDYLNDSGITATISIVPPTGGAPITVELQESEED
jgi:hypothetical protein